MCLFLFIDHSNINSSHLYDDGLYLLEWAKIILANNVISRLTLSWPRPLSYRNQSIDLYSKSMDWFLHDNDLRHKRVKYFLSSASKPSEPMVNICISENCGNLQYDLKIMWNKRLKLYKNCLVGYLNINSLRKKIIDLRDHSVLNLDYFVLSETKIDSSSPSPIDNYKIKARRTKILTGDI